MRSNEFTWPCHPAALPLGIAVLCLLGSSPSAAAAQDLPEVEVANPRCGHAMMVRQLTYYRRTGAWIPESDLRLPAREFLGSVPADPTTLVEVSRYHPDCPATADLQAAAEEFLVRAYRVALERGWDRFDRSRADGFEPGKAGDPNETHFVHLGHSLDDRLLDPEAPEYLMYYPTSDGPLLVGMMFMVRTPEERGPQFGGPQTVWHYHAYEDPACLQDMRISSPHDTPSGPVCPEGATAGFKSPEMLHLWFVDHPEGTYATSMILPPAVLEGGIREDLREVGR